MVVLGGLQGCCFGVVFGFVVYALAYWFPGVIVWFAYVECFVGGWLGIVVWVNALGWGLWCGVNSVVVSFSLV